jgi:hypothetical protein
MSANLLISFGQHLRHALPGYLARNLKIAAHEAVYVPLQVRAVAKVKEEARHPCPLAVGSNSYWARSRLSDVSLSTPGAVITIEQSHTSPISPMTNAADFSRFVESRVH